MDTATGIGVELLSPAGDFETALAAFEAGADAVYCGLADFSARAFAKNLSEEELANLVRFARANGKRVYVTFNTLIDESDLSDAVTSLAALDSIGVDGIIVQDLGIAKIARENFPGLELHASTQLVAHNLEGVLALKELGFKRVVLARELTLLEVESITKRCSVEIECFIHGALCYSISGLCLFSAMEKDRSGNRGRCAYCCRAAVSQPSTYPFSMKDMRLGEDARRLAEAGVASLKIEGRMKSPLYVASVTKYYREILDGAKPTITQADLETVFSRRTTKLYLNGRAAAEKDGVIDPISLGHLGTPIGTVKRITKDREGVRWLRFHTARALEKHDGLQFAAPDGGKPCGFGIGEMRQAISRAPVFEVVAGADVEVRLPDFDGVESIKGGDTVYCSMSNAVKRRFPIPSFRRSDWPGTHRIDVVLEFTEDRLTVTSGAASAEVTGEFGAAKNPSATYSAAEKAFSKLGDSDYSLGHLTLIDPDRRFAPMSVLNELRRRLVAELDKQGRRPPNWEAPEVPQGQATEIPQTTIKLRAGQVLPNGNWDEVVVAIGHNLDIQSIKAIDAQKVRLALPVWTPEPDFNRLRTMVKGIVRQGYTKWEASDLATLRMLKSLGVEDITADWTLYAFNSAALAQVASQGVRRIVASPENAAENMAFLAQCGFPVEFLSYQSTPLFISLNEPAAKVEGEFTAYKRDGLWITVRSKGREFPVPERAPSRRDISWDLEGWQ